jgi:hypothetical protein
MMDDIYTHAACDECFGYRLLRNGLCLDCDLGGQQ